MNFQTRFLKSLFVGAALVALVAMSFARTGADNPPAVRIKNFGSVNNQYYRGAQPEGQDYAALAALGVKTVIDLQEDGETAEAKSVEAAGMKFYRIGMTTHAKPNRKQVDA